MNKYRVNYEMLGCVVINNGRTERCFGVYQPGFVPQSFHLLAVTLNKVLVSQSVK